MSYFTWTNWKESVQLINTLIFSHQFCYKEQVIRLVVYAEVLDIQHLMEWLHWLLFDSAVYELCFPIGIGCLDGELLEGHPHREQIVRKMRITRLEAHMQVVNLHLDVV